MNLYYKGLVAISHVIDHLRSLRQNEEIFVLGKIFWAYSEACKMHTLAAVNNWEDVDTIDICRGLERLYKEFSAYQSETMDAVKMLHEISCGVDVLADKHEEAEQLQQRIACVKRVLSNYTRDSQYLDLRDLPEIGKATNDFATFLSSE